MSNHGWVTPNQNGVVARCGGPGMCEQCRKEKHAWVKPGPDGETPVCGDPIACSRCINTEYLERELYYINELILIKKEALKIAVSYRILKEHVTKTIHSMLDEISLRNNIQELFTKATELQEKLGQLCSRTLT